MKSQVFKKAWQIAKDAVKNFGGKSKEYFREALKQAWSFAKQEPKATEKQVAYLESLIKREESCGRLSDAKDAKAELIKEIKKATKNLLKKEASNWIDCFVSRGFSASIEIAGETYTWTGDYWVKKSKAKSYSCTLQEIAEAYEDFMTDDDAAWIFEQNKDAKKGVIMIKAGDQPLIRKIIKNKKNSLIIS